MSDNISLLPEELRGKEEAMKKNEQPQKPAKNGSELNFFIPVEEGEDIEIIEVDEGEIEQVLANEPFVTRFAYHVTTFFEELKAKLFQPRELEAPPKLPPQFFRPPAPVAPAQAVQPAAAIAPTEAPPGTAPAEAKPASVTGVAPLTIPSAPAPAPIAPLSAKPLAKVQITPFAKTPRRVRVIKRVRKPLRVSFVSAEDLKLLRVDIPKRRFTFITTMLVFVVLSVGSYGLLRYQLELSNTGLEEANRQYDQVKLSIDHRLKDWSAFQNLEPKLRVLSGLLDAHVSPARLLKEIEQVTVNTVYYDSFTLSTDRKVSLAVSADSFESAARQLTAFRRAAFVKRADSSSFNAVYDTDDPTKLKSVQFQIQLSLNDSAMAPEVQEAISNNQ
ncbi:MAG: hypothetical protein WC641_05465 [Patescibacteria group bacterium]